MELSEGVGEELGEGFRGGAVRDRLGEELCNPEREGVMSLYN